jgi:hypothetical protein
LRRVFAGYDIVPRLGSSRVDGTMVERGVSLNLFGGLTGGVRGFEAALLFNIDDASMCGFQMSAATNLVRGPVEGVQLSFVNVAAGRLDGSQLGFVDVATGAMLGAQLGLVDVAADRVRGAQIGLANVAIDEVAGAQIGLANVSRGMLRGAQVGLANVSASQVFGSQVGLVNVSVRPVTGAMVGLVNVGSDASAAIAPVNVMWNGRTHLDVWGTDFGFGMIGVDHGGGRVHNIYGFGGGERSDIGVLSAAFGLGVHLAETKYVFADLDTLAYFLFMPSHLTKTFDFDGNVTRSKGIAGVFSLHVPIGWRITSGIAVFAAPAVDVSVADANGNLLANPSLIASTRLTRANTTPEVRLWPGLSVGARFF